MAWKEQGCLSSGFGLETSHGQPLHPYLAPQPRSLPSPRCSPLAKERAALFLLLFSPFRSCPFISLDKNLWTGGESGSQRTWDQGGHAESGLILRSFPSSLWVTWSIKLTVRSLIINSDWILQSVAHHIIYLRRACKAKGIIIWRVLGDHGMKLAKAGECCRTTLNQEQRKTRRWQIFLWFPALISEARRTHSSSSNLSDSSVL